MDRSKYRLDINGLRGLSIAGVLIYHFRYTIFPGGYSGVDVFYVISGFLITGILLDSSNKGGFLYNFIYKRFIRLLPPLSVVAILSLLFGAFTLPDYLYIKLINHAIESMAYISNFSYWRELDYFSPQAQDNWLIHTWSLSLEMQFYVVYALLFFVIYRSKISLRYFLVSLTLLFFSSLFLSVFMSPYKPEASFYLLPTRMWEMMAGGMVLLIGRSYCPNQFLQKMLAWGGCAIIIMSFVVFDRETVWPGGAAIVPVAGAASILLANYERMPILVSYPLQWLGTRSYSIYLWHWPLIGLLAYYGRYGDVGFTVLALASALLCGGVFYRLVEVPARNYRYWLSRPLLTTVLGGLPFVVAGSLAVLIRSGNLPRGIPPLADAALQEVDNLPERRDECLNLNAPPFRTCLYGKGPIGAVLVGDSHAFSIVGALRKALELRPRSPQRWDGDHDQAVLLIAYSGCPTVGRSVRMRGRLWGEGKRCGRFNGYMLQQLKRVSADVPVFVLNRYAAYMDNMQYSNHGRAKSKIYFEDDYDAHNKIILHSFADHFIETICMISKKHKVFLIAPIPEMPVNVPAAVAKSIMRGERPDVSISVAKHSQYQGPALHMLERAVATCGAEVLDPLPYLCNGGKCIGNQGYVPLYIDTNHLTQKGSLRLVRLLKSALQAHAHNPRQGQGFSPLPAKEEARMRRPSPLPSSEN